MSSQLCLVELIMDNELEDLRRWLPSDCVSPDFSELICCDRSSGTRSRIDRIYTDLKIASNIKTNHIMISFTDHYNAIFIDIFPSKTKIGKDSW